MVYLLIQGADLYLLKIFLDRIVRLWYTAFGSIRRTAFRRYIKAFGIDELRCFFFILLPNFIKSLQGV